MKAAPRRVALRTARAEEAEAAGVPFDAINSLGGAPPPVARIGEAA